LASFSAISIIFCAFTTTIFSTSQSTAHSKERPGKHSSARPLAEPLSYALLCLVILALSPLLKTLTEATTGDSIAALATTLFLLSFTLADYSSPQPTVGESRGEGGGGEEHAPQLPATLSLNASLCSSIVLASRLDSTVQAFSLLLASIFLFAFLPRWVKRHLNSRPNSSFIPCIYTITITVASCSLLAPFSITAAVINSLTAAFLSLACPAWMRKAQGWKQGRRGPWDVGVPRFRSKS